MSQPDPTGKPKRAHWTVATVALFALGLLILILSGLCTAGLGLPILVSSIPMGDLSGVFAVFLFGGLPIGFGISLIIAALKSRPRT